MKKRTGEILEILDEMYDVEWKCYLEYETPWQLLIATILSAQCTDARVNIVTKDLFVKYPSIEAFAKADLKELGFEFVDADLLIQKREKRLLKEIIAEDGVDGFLKVEEEVNAEIEAERTVIATGGSVVYSQKAMEHLKSIGKVVYLKLNFDDLNNRLGNLKGRGVVLKDGQTLKSLYEERTPLYEKYADITVSEDGLNLEETLSSVLQSLIFN